MTRDQKIEALADELRRASNVVGLISWVPSTAWENLGDLVKRHWIAAATLAQDRIDAAGTTWTRVEDGLPSAAGKYLVTRAWARDTVITSDAEYSVIQNDWNVYRVFAWAPLPEPWRG